MTTRTTNEIWARSRTSIFQAIREVVTIAIFTLTPVWAGVLLSLLLRELSSFQAAFYANTDRGDLFLLASALIAPLTLYISVRRGILPRPFTVHFPGGWFFIISLLILFGSSAILFAVKRMADVPTSALKVDEGLFFDLSLVIYFLSFILALVVTAIKYALDAIPFEDTFREETQDFVDAWTRRDK